MRTNSVPAALWRKAAARRSKSATMRTPSKPGPARSAIPSSTRSVKASLPARARPKAPFRRRRERQHAKDESDAPFWRLQRIRCDGARIVEDACEHGRKERAGQRRGGRWRASLHVGEDAHEIEARQIADMAPVRGRRAGGNEAAPSPVATGLPMNAGQVFGIARSETGKVKSEERVGVGGVSLHPGSFSRPGRP